MYNATRAAETAAIERAVARFPEATASDIAEAVLDDLWVEDGGDPDDVEVNGAFEQIRRRAAAEWACPE